MCAIIKKIVELIFQCKLIEIIDRHSSFNDFTDYPHFSAYFLNSICCEFRNCVTQLIKILLPATNVQETLFPDQPYTS